MAENKHKFVVITGTSGGIGQSLFQEFVKSGYHVIAIDKVKSQSSMDRVTFVDFDLTKILIAEQLEFLKNLILNIVGDNLLVGVVNNAAILNVKRVELIELSDWQKAIEINLLVPFFLTSAFLPQLEQSSGSVVNISSIHAKVTKPGFITYATSKGALSSLTRSLSVELGRKVRVNAIEPGAVETEMLINSFADDLESLKILGDFHPIGRIAKPFEIAHLVIFLISENSRFINGACISIDGGTANRLYDPE